MPVPDQNNLLGSQTRSEQEVWFALHIVIVNPSACLHALLQASTSTCVSKGYVLKGRSSIYAVPECKHDLLRVTYKHVG